MTIALLSGSSINYHRLNYILAKSRIDILELVQCLASMLVAKMDQPVYCKLINLTGFSRADIEFNAKKMTTQLATDIQQALDSVQFGVTIKFRVINKKMHFDYYCDDQKTIYFSTQINGKPRLEEKLPELFGEPIKVRIHSDDLSLQDYFRSFEQTLNIECITHTSKEENDLPCELEIKDYRHLADFDSKTLDKPSHPFLMLKGIEQIQGGSGIDDRSLFWPFFDSDLHKVLGELDRTSKLRVFVADDSKPSKMATMIMLEHLGCTLTGADDGLEALEITKSQPFDLIFLDERMPGLFGSDVAEQLRDGDGVNAKCPKISLTGITDRDSVAKLYEKGITHHIEKPITRLVLENFLKQWQKV